MLMHKMEFSIYNSTYKLKQLTGLSFPTWQSQYKLSLCQRLRNISGVKRLEVIKDKIRTHVQIIILMNRTINSCYIILIHCNKMPFRCIFIIMPQQQSSLPMILPKLSIHCSLSHSLSNFSKSSLKSLSHIKTF